jgi:subtilisin family serine protease
MPGSAQYLSIDSICVYRRKIGGESQGADIHEESPMNSFRSFRRTLGLVLRTGSAAVLTLSALSLAAGPASAAEGRIRETGTASVVKDSYIVVLKSGAGVPATARSLRGTYGGKVGYTYEHALSGFEISVGEAAARRMAADPRVSYVQRNGVFRVTTTQSNPPWGLDRIDQRALPLSSSYTYDTTASNVHAYIIDTGIRFSHQQFGGRAVSGRDTVDNDNNASDCAGHGTHVAGTVGGSTYGVAKGVQLVAVRVLNCSGSGSTAGVVAGIDWVTANAIKPAVANMSLGGGADSTLDAAVNRSIASGITYAVASGNDNANACNGSPARVPAAITVNAVTSTNARAGFSDYGSCTDIFAPGNQILSSWYTSDTATNTISGTSMATPHVTGAAALVLAVNPGYTPAQVAAALVADATAGVVTNPGSGSPNLLLYTAPGRTTPTPTMTPTAPTGPPPTTAITTPATTPVTTGATAPATTPPPGGCTATLAVTNSWSGGFTASVRVTASQPVTHWSVALTVPAGTAVSSVWNGTLDGTTVANAAWNGTLAANASTDFGFQGTGSPVGLSAGTCAAG